ARFRARALGARGRKSEQGHKGLQGLQGPQGRKGVDLSSFLVLVVLAVLYVFTRPRNIPRGNSPRAPAKVESQIMCSSSSGSREPLARAAARASTSAGVFGEARMPSSSGRLSANR